MVLKVFVIVVELRRYSTEAIRELIGIRWLPIAATSRVVVTFGCTTAGTRTASTFAAVTQV